MEEQELIRQAMSAMGKRSWEKQKKTRDSEFFRQMVKKRWDKKSTDGKLSTDKA